MKLINSKNNFIDKNRGCKFKIEFNLNVGKT